MDDITAMLSGILSDPKSMQQIQSIASSLGLAPTASQPALPPPQSQSAPPNTSPDLSALQDLLGNLGANAQSGSQSSGQTPDLSALQDLLGGLGGASTQSGGGDLSALTSLLSAGNPPQPEAASPAMPFDMNTLLKLQKAMSSVTANKANIDMLMALKPRLKPDRAKKVDDAVRVMQLIQFLPLIKESGLFGELDTGAGLGGIVGGIGEGINGLLGNLFGGRR